MTFNKFDGNTFNSTTPLSLELEQLVALSVHAPSANFSGRGPAPELAYVRQTMNTLWDDYQRNRPGSAASAALLSEVVRECKSLLVSLIPCSYDASRIQLLPGTSRALEVG